MYVLYVVRIILCVPYDVHTVYTPYIQCRTVAHDNSNSHQQTSRNALKRTGTEAVPTVRIHSRLYIDLADPRSHHLLLLIAT
jgi:hypothetical protein